MLPSCCCHFCEGFKEGKVARCGSGQYRGIDSCGGKRGVTEYELCDNVSEYVFFDSGHPTERVYQQVSSLMSQDLTLISKSCLKFRQKCGLINFFDQLRILQTLLFQNKFMVWYIIFLVRMLWVFIKYSQNLTPEFIRECIKIFRKEKKKAQMALYI